jgi:hypothetical protein
MKRPLRPSDEEFHNARNLADTIVRRALADPHFREQLKANPTAVLEKAGLSADAIEDLEKEIRMDGHPLKPKPCAKTCWYTCFWTSWF